VLAFAKAHPHEPLKKTWHTSQPRCTLLEIDLGCREVALKVLVVGAGPAGAATALLLAAAASM
jgi:NADPH-dependent 2,4-dienoyl-CoA reductase/sulfur reductase-like enzyme